MKPVLFVLFHRIKNEGRNHCNIVPQWVSHSNVSEWMNTSTDVNRYALVFQDYLTKWPEVFPVKNRSATTVATCLTELL